MKRLALTIAMGLLLTVSTALPHHSFSAEFDENRPVTLVGTVTEFEFMNPHSWIHLDVKGEDGKVVRWDVETGSTNSLFRRGWKKDSLKPGDQIKVEAYRAKNGSNTANANSVTLPDGRDVLAGSSREESSTR